MLHFTWSNIRGNYTVSGETLNSIHVQRDHNSLEEATQRDRVVKMTYSLLAFTGHGIEYRKSGNYVAASQDFA